MSGGWLRVVGLGPGSAGLLVPEAAEWLAQASDLVGYAPYLARVQQSAGQIRHASDNREELARARHALTMAADGRRVAVVSGGDPGVFAMASAVFEALEAGPVAWRALDIAVVPGISAMFAAAARLGAPLGADFCAISLSDNLKPWPVLAARLRAVAGAGLVIALYNARSQARPDLLGQAFDVLRDVLPGNVPVVLAHSISRPDARLDISTLADIDPTRADMRTLVLIGTEATRVIERPGAAPFLYAPRFVAAR